VFDWDALVREATEQLGAAVQDLAEGVRTNGKVPAGSLGHALQALEMLKWARYHEERETEGRPWSRV